MSKMRPRLHRPDANFSVPLAIDEKAVLKPQLLYYRACRRFVIASLAAIPMPSICLIVDLDNGLPRGRSNASRVKRHARNARIVCICVVDAPSAEVPDL
jgi:hypothetical protein